MSRPEQRGLRPSRILRRETSVRDRATIRVSFDINIYTQLMYLKLHLKAFTFFRVRGKRTVDTFRDVTGTDVEKLTRVPTPRVSVLSLQGGPFTTATFVINTYRRRNTEGECKRRTRSSTCLETPREKVPKSFPSFYGRPISTHLVLANFFGYVIIYKTLNLLVKFWG